MQAVLGSPFMVHPSMRLRNPLLERVMRVLLGDVFGRQRQTLVHQ